jgi:hypothetical protein
MGSGVPAASAPRRAAKVTAVALVAGALFFLYWRQSSWAPTNSDGASNALQAWDMLHGNLLLHGWRLSDVSFYTTELPQYMLIEVLFGLGPWVVHVAGVMTYLLLLLLTALLAKGRADGGEGLTRALLAAGIMVSPQVDNTSALLLGPDHTGTAVPVLLAWLIVDRARARWYVPVTVCLILAWTFVADSLVLVTGIAPLVLACALRAGLARGKQPAWYEVSLAAAGLAAVGLGWAAMMCIRAAGGYATAAVSTATVTGGQLRHSAWVTFRAALEAFGANVFSAGHGIEYAFVLLHFVGVALVAVAMVIAVARFFRTGDRVVPVLALAITLNLVAYMISVAGLYISARREIVAVLPFGAALAGRLLAGRLLAGRVLALPAFKVIPIVIPIGAIACGYLAALGYAATLPSLPAANEPLAAWLTAHHLTDGLATYWLANSTTLDSEGRIQVSSVQADNGRLVPGNWETLAPAYDPARHDAEFFAIKDWTEPPAVLAAARSTFGPPPHTYHAAGYTIFVWNTNLLPRLGRP